MKKVILLGASGKIGRVLCAELVRDGFHVVGVCRSRESESALRTAFEGTEAFEAFALDILDRGEFAAFLKTQVQAGADAIIHNARALDPEAIGANGWSPPEKLIQEFEMACVPAYLSAQALVEAPTESQKRLVLISSMYGVVAPPHQLYDNFHKESPVQYGVAKAAQVHLAKELASRYGRHGLATNAICYGGVAGRASGAFLERYEKVAPNGRMLVDADLYEPVSFLLKASDSVLGHSLMVEGGWTST